MDTCDGFPVSYARETIREDTGFELEDLFDDFEPIPFASASVGQVHLAKLKGTGTRVAVKVRHPFIEEQFDQQFKFIRILARLSTRSRRLRHLRVNEVLGELVYAMREEIDYRIEFSNIRRMGTNLRAHKVYVPKGYPELSTKRLLVMEYLEGCLVSDFIHMCETDPGAVRAWQDENNIDGGIVARRLYHSMLRQMYEDNLFHGDLHPGNVILLRNNRLALIDFGSVGFTETEFLERYASFFRAIALRDYSRATDVLFLMFSTMPRIDLQEVREEFIRVFRAWEVRTEVESMPFHERSISSLVGELISVAHSHRISSSWLFLRLERAGITLDCSLRYLDPHFNYPKRIRAYFRNQMRRERVRRGTVEAVTESFEGFLNLASTAPKLVDEFTMFHVPMMRRQALVFQTKVSEMSHLLYVAAREVGRVAKITILLLAFGLIQRAFPRAIPSFAPDVGGVLPDWPGIGWVLAFSLLIYLTYVAGSFRTRLQALGRT